MIVKTPCNGCPVLHRGLVEIDLDEIEAAGDAKPPVAARPLRIWASVRHRDHFHTINVVLPGDDEDSWFLDESSSPVETAVKKGVTLTFDPNPWEGKA